MRIKTNVTIVDGIAVVSLTGDDDELSLTDYDVNGLREELLKICNNNQYLAIDMSNIRFMESSFIETLFRVCSRLSTKDKLRPGHLHFCLFGLTDYIRAVLVTTHLDRLWKLLPTQEDAITAILLAKSPT